MKKIKFFISVIIALLLLSCAQDDTCRTDKNIGMHAGFYLLENKTNLQIDSITVYGKDVDSLLYNNSKNIDKIKLPLNPQTENCTYILKINETYDTLKITYSNKEYFISYACGMIISHKLDTILHSQHSIQKVEITNHQIDLTDAEHLQIYF